MTVIGDGPPGAPDDDRDRDGRDGDDQAERDTSEQVARRRRAAEDAADGTADIVPGDDLIGAPHVGDTSIPDDLVREVSGDDIAAATADLDDDAPLVPDSPPLTLSVVESLLDRRRNEVQISPTLTRITALLDLIGNPQQAYPVVQVAGTNGKTSTVRMVDALLTSFGLRTGRFTSPHLQLVTERIALDGAPIDPDTYVAAYDDLAPYIDLVDAASERDGGAPLSKFEVLTAMAYAAFADAPVDVAVIETGLGGTWDSTTVADARIAAITPIGIDHVEFLGDTLAEIAGNKAGIVKKDATAIIGPQEPAAMEVLIRRAIEVDATVARYGSEFSVLDRAVAVGGQKLTLQGLSGVYEDVFLPLSGEHQAVNASVALACVEAFFGAGAGTQLDLGVVQDAFASVSTPGRLERVRTSPTILVDAAHNPHGAAALAAALAAEFSFARLVGVIAVMGDKDVRALLEALVDTFDEVVVTVNSSPRSMPLEDLHDLAVDVFGEERVHTAARMDEAIGLAVDLTEDGADDMSGTGVVVTGSVVSAGDARTLTGLSPS
ncbi:bifunctional folylpolyglutamate synthase/dihydrofolate synthase [Nakamurella flavida]|uniref:tetrahydrofolate synthase n=1 Tax=Nakamurella flavida TaxID=363630 RepID=A0A939C6D6_9ACTN|nr:folylpolyglutamate synthase/dihydrofolate synthase family protein [Nakamurella flavida]MBM9477092.1 bifunctional folylpolyglutamate synthase/dihydrofolate synthase [Nakamurella flavida]MDP9780038.1 dihydrofolate synthase/folylpolyglutamate synthase [Nakamurella flavida]